MHSDIVHYREAVAAFVKQEKCTESHARALVAKRQPVTHLKFILATNCANPIVRANLEKQLRELQLKRPIGTK